MSVAEGTNRWYKTISKQTACPISCRPTTESLLLFLFTLFSTAMSTSPENLLDLVRVGQVSMRALLPLLRLAAITVSRN